MNQTADIKRKRGRPPKTENADFRDTRETLITASIYHGTSPRRLQLSTYFLASDF